MCLMCPMCLMCLLAQISQGIRGIKKKRDVHFRVRPSLLFSLSWDRTETFSQVDFFSLYLLTPRVFSLKQQRETLLITVNNISHYRGGILQRAAVKLSRDFS